MRILSSLITFTLCINNRVVSALAVSPSPVPLSFVPAEEYTLSHDYAYDGSQALFDISPAAYIPTDSDGEYAGAHGAQEPVRGSPTLTLQARPTVVYRPRSAEAYQRARVSALRGENAYGEEEVEWEEVEVLGPYVEDRHTLSQLARMTGNAYALPGKKNWYDIDATWNHSFPFGWEDAADGFRGHVFLSADNATVVLAIKGTTLQGPTSKKDKFNDNLLFSCCCARVDFSWVFSTVCGCYAKNWRCDNGCLSKALIEESLFYNVGVHLISNLTALYPTSTIWLVGHSLGGSLASLLGMTFGLPAVAFEAPGERLAAQRLKLPLPPPPSSSNISLSPNSNTSLSPCSSSPSPPTSRFGTPPVTHVYHNADPIPQGACTGIGSLCAEAGYALETRCHLGKTIVYDTVGRLGWRVDVKTHTIKNVITKVIEAPLEGGWEVGEDGVELDVPVAREEVDCMDCYKWEFGDYGQSSCIV